MSSARHIPACGCATNDGIFLVFLGHTWLFKCSRSVIYSYTGEHRIKNCSLQLCFILFSHLSFYSYPLKAVSFLLSSSNKFLSSSTIFSSFVKVLCIASWNTSDYHKDLVEKKNYLSMASSFPLTSFFISLVISSLIST